MKKIYSTVLLLLLILSLSFLSISCNNDKNNDKEKINFFKTEQFTKETFFSAVKKYGKKSDFSGSYFYFLTDNQEIAAYENSSVKALMTSNNYDSAPEDIHLVGLWEIMYEDIFSNEHSYTIKSLFETVKEKCVQKLSTGTHSLIGSAEKYMAKNNSVVNLCKNNGYKIFAAFENENFELYKGDLVDLFIETNTFDNKNANIACHSSIGYYPLAFDAFYCYSPNWKSEGSGYGFANSSAYKDLLRCIKTHLKDPDSYQSNGAIQFYSTAGIPVKDGYYTGTVYAFVPFRAKNGFGGYVTDTVWLTYNWNFHSFSWYSSYAPSNINSYPFETEYVN